jgi:phenylalanine-4-hydroxylase
MKQEYTKYTADDLNVWQKLFSRQMDNLSSKGSEVYLASLAEMKEVLNVNKIPDFVELNKVLENKHGWTIEVVKGLIPVDEFFQLLSEKKFCASTWLRTLAQLDYLDEPDMFHDIFGHIPLLMNEDFSKFAEGIGNIALNYLDDEVTLTKLQRIYWFTIEFGLINENDGIKGYGAGIMSSFGETNHIFEDNIIIHPFDMAMVIEKEFISTEIQNEYVIIDSYNQLFESLDELKKLLNKKSS